MSRPKKKRNTFLFFLVSSCFSLLTPHLKADSSNGLIISVIDWRTYEVEDRLAGKINYRLYDKRVCLEPNKEIRAKLFLKKQIIGKWVAIIIRDGERDGQIYLADDSGYPIEAQFEIGGIAGLLVEKGYAKWCGGYFPPKDACKFLECVQP